VPPSLIDKSVAGETEKDAEALARGFYGEREGYANTHDLPPAEAFARASTGGTPANDEGEAPGRSGAMLTISRAVANVSDANTAPFIH